VGTALALVAFAQANVDVAVVEVGVGGATDATNVLEPALSMIGPVGLDHRATLGPDLASIAHEKAGVARYGIDVIVGRQQPEALRVIETHACQVGAHPWTLGRDFWADARSPSEEAFEFAGPVRKIGGLHTPLRGEFQLDNAITAVAAAVALTRAGWSIADDAIRAGLSRVEWPGRFQTVVSDPLTIVDGAHNASAAHALRSAIERYLAGRCVTLVLGMADDKDVRAFLAELAPVVERVVVTRARHPRSTDPGELAAVVREAGVPCVTAPTPSAALCQAWTDLPDSGAVLVSGSLFLVGDVMEWLIDAPVRVQQAVG
jgi:dihydrofolate synthase / folylpolyglutamate synthase